MTSSLGPDLRISVCICTYNREISLRRTLQSLCLQKSASLTKHEILVVDNNSSDRTEDVVAEFQKTLQIRRVLEPKQGLSYARNKAVLEARGDVLIFTDDDVRVEQNWLVAYQAALARFPNVEYFGGRILPDWGAHKPRWLREPLPLVTG